MQEPAELRVARDARALCAAAVAEVLSHAREAVTRRGSFHLALCGGSTPRALYAALAASGTDCSDWELWFGDERCVPPGHPRSNYRMVEQTWLVATTHPPRAVHRMNGEAPAAEAARAYERSLREVLGDPPRLDLALLGLGADGHTASLFPDSPALDEQERLVVATEAPPPLEARLTLTVPALRLSRNLLWLVQGSEKARALHNVIDPSSGLVPLPARRVAEHHPGVLWLVDSAAAAELPPR